MADSEDADDIVADFPFQEDAPEPDETYRCEVCDQEFDTERGRNIHRGQAHSPE
ncbi:hypothetical protein [Halovenus marina]|uniref:hypothetical protein n=1 Tax=Halovenus marina TaxID=3396621 RepID=UPI003F579FC5